MRKIVVLCSVLFGLQGTLQAQAQDFQGMAVYESKTSTSDFKSRMDGNKDLTPEMKAMIEDRMRKMLEKTYVLHFDKTASVYKEEQKLEAPGQNAGGFRMMSSMMGIMGTFYKNVKTKTFTVDREYMGKEFVVVDSLPQLQWKMENETKKIGDYTCFKATAIKVPNASDLRNLREKKKSDKEKAESKPTTPMNMMEDFELPKEILITAWYTPEIPINQGPENYWGLPGLILEISDGKTVTVCSKVVMNTKNKVEIKPVKKGKEVTQKEYDEIVVKKMAEMREQFQSQGGNGGMMRMGR